MKMRWGLPNVPKQTLRSPFLFPSRACHFIVTVFLQVSEFLLLNYIYLHLARTTIIYMHTDMSASICIYILYLETPRNMEAPFVGPLVLLKVRFEQLLYGLIIIRDHSSPYPVHQSRESPMFLEGDLISSLQQYVQQSILEIEQLKCHWLKTTGSWGVIDKWYIIISLRNRS